MSIETTDDAVLGGRLRLLQPRRGHRVGHDAILLAASTAALPGETAFDFGAGVGAAGLALAQRVSGLAVRLIEIDAGLARLAAENAARNGLADRVSAHALDVADVPAGFADRLPADRVLMNPPFTDRGRHPASPDARRRTAHAADADLLRRWIGVAEAVLRPGGVLTLIHRADALRELMAALDGFGSVAVQPVHPRPDAAAIRILLRAGKGNSTPLTVLPGLNLQTVDGRPNAENVMRQGAVLPLAALG